MSPAKPKPRRRSGKSGKTKLRRRSVYLTHDEDAEIQERADAAGVNWSAWARRRLTSAEE